MAAEETCTTCGRSFEQRTGPGRPWEKCPKCRRYRNGAAPPPANPLPPRPAGIMSVSEAAEHGTRADLLAAIRWRAEQAFFDPSTKSAALISLSKLITDIVQEQAQIEADSPPKRRLNIVDEPWDGPT